MGLHNVRVVGEKYLFLHKYITFSKSNDVTNDDDVTGIQTSI